MNKTVDLQQLQQLTKDLATKLSPPLLITLEGELGTGKTQFTKFLTQNLLNSTQAHSPTFSLINEYKGWLSPIYHVDLYRLKSAKDLESSGFWDLFAEDALIIVEWSNLLSEKWMPLNWPRWQVQLKMVEGKTHLRSVEISFLNERTTRHT